MASSIPTNFIRTVVSNHCVAFMCFMAFMHAAFATDNQAPNYTLPLYQDDHVTVHEIQARSSSYSRVFLRAVHKASADTELFGVQTTRPNKGLIAYQYDSGVYEQARKWLGERYADPKMEALFITHFVAGTRLPHEPTLANADWQPSYGPGRPVAMYSLFNQARRKGRDPVNWKPSYALPVSSHTIVGRGYLNTLSKAQAWQVNMPAKELNDKRQASVIAQNNSTTSDTQGNPLKVFGYGSATFIGGTGGVRYYLTPSTSTTSMNVAALHTGLGDDEYVIGLDPLLTRNERGDYVLSYILLPEEISNFNQVLGQKLRRVDGSANVTQVRHYVAGKSAGKLLDRWGGTFNEMPVFAQAYHWYENKAQWRPSYEAASGKNQSGIGRFDTWSTRYSINSTKAYIEYLNKKDRQPSLQFTKTPVDELNAALASGSDQLRARHKKYALWSDGYWAFNKISVARDVINGNFSRVQLHRDFRYLFVNFMRAYSEACQAYIRNPQKLTYVLTEREIDAHGFTVNEDVTQVSVVLPADYLEIYDKYWNNASDRAAIMVAAFKAFDRSNKTPGVSSQFFRSSAYREAARTMLRIDACNEPAPQRLLDNLLRRAKGEPPIKSGISLSADEK